MNIAIIATNVIVFLVGLSQSAGAHPAGQDAPPFPVTWNHFMLNYPGGLHLYQFITYQFLHASFMHIGANMLFLYVFGNNLNEKLGHIGYLAFYLAGGVFAGCGQVLTSSAPTLGASGAISAVMGLFLILLPKIHIRLFVWIFIYLDTNFEIASVYFILLKVGQDIFEQFEASRTGMGGGVAYMAHVAGTVLGIIVGLVLLATKLVQRDHYDLLAIINRYRRQHEYRSVVAKGYDPFSYAGGPVAANAPARRGAEVTPAVDPRIASLRAEISRLMRLHDFPDATRRYLELRAIEGTQVLPPQEQVDAANQLMADKNYAAAATAYEDYLRVYPSGGAGQQDQLQLMLGLIYARYISQPARAKEIFTELLPRLHDAGQKELVAGELKWLEGQPNP